MEILIKKNQDSADKKNQDSADKKSASSLAESPDQWRYYLWREPPSFERRSCKDP